MDYIGRLYKYAHLPLQIVWFSSEEWMIFFMGYLTAVGLDGAACFIGPAVAYAAYEYKKGRPRGFFSHTQIKIGLKRLQGYPPYQARVFLE